MASLGAVRLAYQTGNLAEAFQQAKRILRDDNECYRAWELLGLVQFARGRFAIAVAALERVSLYLPLMPNARVCLALAYGKIGKCELSRDLLRELIVDEALDDKLLLRVAAGLNQINSSHLAIEAARTATKRFVWSARAHFELGYYCARCNYPSHIVESLARRAVSLEPDNVSYRVGLASFLLRHARIFEAYECIQHFDPKHLQQVSCHCCLVRLDALFKQFGDTERVQFCRERLQYLTGRGPGCLYPLNPGEHGPIDPRLQS